MKNRLFASLLIAALILLVLGPSTAGAYAYEAGYITSITYQNIGTAATTTLSINFYEGPTTTVPINIPRPNLNQNAGTSVYIGSLTDISPGFEGTAVLEADQQLAATLVQNPQDSRVKIAPISNGFSSGTANSLLATVIKNTFGVNTKFSVQNAGSGDTTATVNFYAVGVAAPVHSISQALEPGAGFFVDMGTLAMPAPYTAAFNGSVVVTGGGGSIVSSAMELDTGTGIGAKAFEGVGAGSTTVYMPSAACVYYGMSSAYAVQNTSSNPADTTTVTVTYQPGGLTQTANISPGGKASFISCNVLSPGFLGAAKITTTGGVPVIAVGKVTGNGGATAFEGFPNGFARMALPYVRWATQTNFDSGYMGRTNLTIENTSGGNIPAGAITVTYYDRTGAPLGTPHTFNSILADGAKFNSNPTNSGLTEFGCYNSCTQFGGSAIVRVNSPYTVAVVARHGSKFGTTFPSEDYDGIPVLTP